MLLVVDVGNTNTVFGIFENGNNIPLFHKRTVTRKDRTSDELGLFFRGFLREFKIENEMITGGIYSSVVPTLNPILDRMFQDWFKIEAIRVHYQIKLPFSISYPRPYEIGADRLVNAAACAIDFPGKSIIIDLGTATTFCVVNEKPEYLGGVIAPGLKVSMDALTRNTSQLPPIVFQSPGKILGDSTIESIQSGFFFGWIGLLEGIIREIKKDKGEDYQVVGTGGLVTVIDAAHPGIFDKIDPLLTLRGLQILHLMNS
ncbi:type III pantothenate kinase [Leptospira noguchii]|uniref:Type III pantothenate kinase n=2 Tax=Leptospira noguchii TaxID=28182 RepID=M6VEA3_9LEPT|nr:type III pantothenate kinase [Leptospira noguchii]EMI71872.1 putative pantothenate kinase, type III [Leptospira noguchii str. Bonito]EMO40002.1 putative pantothenate kinase, type III [Leptospira noguchii serovar Autumnalis str. ZUN142]EMO55802.1 putative pantothenate kinase, type III [Leptospira noguchii]EMS86414.1 putative pantothenate kinase, type III [Leptospira noguchii str. Hook]EMS89646.1 putative pantothenate kinase, type III [Leptospira noguchii str. Cascata]